MKKRLFIISVFCALICFNVSDKNLAFADTNYLRVINSTTPFYRDSGMQSLVFNLPYTYYVKVLSVDGDTAHIECYGQTGTIAMDGYTVYSSLYKDGLNTDNPYLTQTITTSSPTKLYSDTHLINAERYLFQDRTLSYYGSLETEHGIIYYVSYNGEFGYVKEDAVYPFTILDHPNELTFLVQNLPPTESETENAPSLDENKSQGDELLTIRIVIISCLVLAGLIALFTVKRPKKIEEPVVRFYDENEYE